MNNKFVWTWNDGEDTYLNKSESLLDIVQNVVEYWLDGEGHPEVVVDEDFITVSFDTDRFNDFDEDELDENDKFHISSEQTPELVAGMLDHIARQLQRPDTFDIDTI